MSAPDGSSSLTGKGLTTKDIFGSTSITKQVTANSNAVNGNY